MATLPKSSAEILAAAKKRFQSRKFEPDFETYLSAFSVDLSANTGCAATSLPLQSQPTTSNVHSIGSTYYFKDPITLRTLESAVKLKETKDVKPEETEDLFDDVPANTWVLSCTQYIMCYIYFFYLRHSLRVNLNLRLIAYRAHSRAYPSRIAFRTCSHFYDTTGLVLLI